MKYYICTMKRLGVMLLLCCLMGQTAVVAGGNKRNAENYSRSIEALYKTRQVDSMKIVLEEALELYPEDADLNRWAGTYFLQQKEPDNARYFLLKAVEFDPNHFPAKQQLVALEEESGNLSSAICYVNEMLEMYPYDPGLWKKKIGLYRKQGNDREADRLLERLCSIYPNDTTVQNDYLNRIEEEYQYQKRMGNRHEAIGKLRQLLKYRSREKTYYLDLGNLLLQEGHGEEAVAVLSKGLEQFPLDDDLLRKKAEIMAMRGNSKEAVELLKKNESGALVPLADNLLLEAARSEGWKDPYVLYGKVYESRKSEEALDYLIRTSFSREYNEDALYYLSEYRKRNGDTPENLYREYRIYQRTNNRNSAIKALEKYTKLERTDADMADELALLRMERADEYVQQGRYAEATLDLDRALSSAAEAEIRNAILGKQIFCYMESGKNDAAIALIDSVRTVRNDNSLYVYRKAEYRQTYAGQF